MKKKKEEEEEEKEKKEKKGEEEGEVMGSNPAKAKHFLLFHGINLYFPFQGRLAGDNSLGLLFTS